MQELFGLGRGEVSVFRLSADDWVILRDLRLDALRESPEAFLGDFEAETKYLERNWRRELELNVWFLARVGERAVGIAKLNHLAQLDDGMHLEAMWIAPDVREMGIGTCLVSAVEADAAERGAEKMRLWVFEENPSARTFYLRLGYVESGRRQPIKVNDRVTVETEFEKQFVIA